MSTNATGTPAVKKQRTCGLYVHTPFCPTKCGYCDFYSVALKERDMAPLVDALVVELNRRLETTDYLVETVFVGGGTPTMFTPRQLARVLNAIHAHVDIVSLYDFTVEANPATVDAEKADVLAAHGVRRVSLGAQSFSTSDLAVLERVHNPQDVGESVALLRQAGIGQINLDLIFGTPGQTLESWQNTLTAAHKLNPQHIACYALVYEPGTRLTSQLKSGRITPCPEDLEWHMYELAVQQLAGWGYRQYEISNFCLPGFESAHNLMYWRNRPYIGVGPSAVGMLDGRRYKNVCSVDGYVGMIRDLGHAENESERISCAEYLAECIMMQIRLNEGLNAPQVEADIGVSLHEVLQPALHRLERLGMVHSTGDRIALTNKGRPIANAVIRELAFAADRNLMGLEVTAACLGTILPVLGG